MKNGLIHLYLGNGKGKSTALFGLALRALGRDFKVLIIQFLKTGDSGEVIYLNKLNDSNLSIKSINFSNKFTWEMNEKEIKLLKIQLNNFFEELKLTFSDYDFIMFDELLDALELELIPESEIINIIKNKHQNQEFVFTGRNASDTLLSLADYVSHIDSIKHPFTKGTQARIGIEF